MTIAHDLGRGRLVLGVPNGLPQKILRIDAAGASPTLIGRLLVGGYITGQDQAVVSARGGLTPEQRSEIHRVVDRLLGMSVVNEGETTVEVQNFIDPTKYELPRLIHREEELLRSELEICRGALSGDPPTPLDRLPAIEEEVDRLYLLMARQLLLSSDDPRVARGIHVESHHYQVGYRLVAKALEVVGDLVHGIGEDLQQHLAEIRRLPPSLTRELLHRLQRLEDDLARTMEAFTALSIDDANAILNEIAETAPKAADLGQVIARSVPDHKLAVATQRVVCNLTMALEMLVIINEVTLNRSVEPRPAPSGTCVVTDVRRRPTPAVSPTRRTNPRGQTRGS